MFIPWIFSLPLNASWAEFPYFRDDTHWPRLAVWLATSFYSCWQSLLQPQIEQNPRPSWHFHSAPVADYHYITVTVSLKVSLEEAGANNWACDVLFSGTTPTNSTEVTFQSIPHNLWLSALKNKKQEKLRHLLLTNWFYFMKYLRAMESRDSVIGTATG
jgi:hypothetical protein